jgi:hypothetical protein
MMAVRRAEKNEIKATQQASGTARTLAESLPRLILEARRIAATVIHGLHGRKRAGPGENFWQYRRFVWGEPARRVDWRRSARPGPESGDLGKLISWGPSPRASQALMLVARARALIDGRLSPSIDDVLDMAEPILKHRMALTFAARADGESTEGVIAKLKARSG